MAGDKGGKMSFRETGRGGPEQSQKRAHGVLMRSKILDIMHGCEGAVRFVGGTWLWGFSCTTKLHFLDPEEKREALLEGETTDRDEEDISAAGSGTAPCSTSQPVLSARPFSAVHLMPGTRLGSCQARAWDFLEPRPRGRLWHR